MNSAQQHFAGSNIANKDMDFANVSRLLLANRRLICGLTLAFALAGLGYAYVASPVYESNVMLRVDDSPDPANNKSMIDDVSSISDAKSSPGAESQILASRAVVARTVANQLLYIDAKPRRFPLIGGVIGRHAESIGDPGLFGLGGFAWGNETIAITKFEVPARVEGKKFELTVLQNGKYELSGPAFERRVIGTIGKTEHYSTQRGPVDILVSSVAAEPGIVFDLYRNSTTKTIERIQRELSVLEKVKDSGIVVGTLRGEDATVVSNTLKEIAQQYIRQNTERKSLEASSSLLFLNKQLPVLKAKLEQAQQSDTDLHKQSGIVDLPEEARQAITQAGMIKTQLLALQQQRRDLASRFVGNDFPAIKSIDDQIRALETQLDAYTAKLARFPDMQQEVARSEMQVKVDTALYTTLLNNAQQLELVKAGKVGTVSMIDTPLVPEDPVFPKKSVFALLGALFGLLVGIGATLVRNSILRGIDNPHDIERTLGIDVYATVPYSKRQQVMLKMTRKAPRIVGLLAEVSTADPAVESLRGLRMALNRGLLDVPNKIVLVTGATPGVGKSFISANFARVLATSGRRVLLIDADLRNGHLHRYFNFGPERGLADLLDGRLGFEDVLQKEVTPNLDFISTGSLPTAPGELLLSPRLNSMLTDCANRYDFVLIDSPPLLAVSDASVLAQSAGTIFLVALSDVTKMTELEECSKRMLRSGAHITGVIFNGSSQKTGDYSYGYPTNYPR
jgi:tyrosine-protein kinase Etk/Wzc